MGTYGEKVVNAVSKGKNWVHRKRLILAKTPNKVKSTINKLL